ncbi:hypothetical protein [Haladaptatus caseinilyticus]|uniref:hypothetical protein n=1 Tax=Haladaptatus caseinilyticus TaxID=2993314 RepID=UPI00224AF9FF|nr:hypothetical protein [Haladaptatus caseinilyticus]
MAFRSIREMASILDESRDAIREGRIAIEEAKSELEARHRARKRRIERIERAIELIRTDGLEADLQRLVMTLTHHDDFDHEGGHSERGM